jgi:hypothetical protein
VDQPLKRRVDRGMLTGPNPVCSPRPGCGAPADGPPVFVLAGSIRTAHPAVPSEPGRSESVLPPVVTVGTFTARRCPCSGRWAGSEHHSGPSAPARVLRCSRDGAPEASHDSWHLALAGGTGAAGGYATDWGQDRLGYGSVPVGGGSEEVCNGGGNRCPGRSAVCPNEVRRTVCAAARMCLSGRWLGPA